VLHTHHYHWYAATHSPPCRVAIHSGVDYSGQLTEVAYLERNWTDLAYKRVMRFMPSVKMIVLQIKPDMSDETASRPLAGLHHDSPMSIFNSIDKFPETYLGPTAQRTIITVYQGLQLIC